MARYICDICGFTYDEDAGLPDQDIAPGTKWADLPDDWTCPICGAPKSSFHEQAAPDTAPVVNVDTAPPAKTPATDEVLREVSFGELSAICTNLSLACSKMQLAREEELFRQLGDYFLAKAPAPDDADFDSLAAKVQADLSGAFPEAKAAADDASDRGAKRVLTWSEKVSVLLGSLLKRTESEGSAFVESTNVWVCDVCGFIYVGDTPPDICPICKVPSFKLLKVER